MSSASARSPVRRSRKARKASRSSTSTRITASGFGASGSVVVESVVILLWVGRRGFWRNTARTNTGPSSTPYTDRTRRVTSGRDADRGSNSCFARANFADTHSNGRRSSTSGALSTGLRCLRAPRDVERVRPGERSRRRVYSTCATSRQRPDGARRRWVQTRCFVSADLGVRSVAGSPAPRGSSLRSRPLALGAKRGAECRATLRAVDMIRLIPLFSKRFATPHDAASTLQILSPRQQETLGNSLVSGGFAIPRVGRSAVRS